jgi:GNAT superfamily N-acetyltransferase
MFRSAHRPGGILARAASGIGRVLTLRRARPDERDDLEALQRRASIAVEEYRNLILAHPDAIDLPLEHILGGNVGVAERDGRVVGFFAVLSKAGGVAELDGLFVDPASWRCGIGRRLVREAERWAAHAAATVLHVIANPTAKDFYLACGFRITGEAQTRFGVAPTMVKQVAALS